MGTDIQVGSIVIDSIPASMERGSRKLFTATVKDTKGKVVTVPLVWRSSNETVAVFEPDGHLLAKDEGITGITASSLGVTSGAAPIRVVWLGAAKVAVTQWTQPAAATPSTPLADSIRVLVTNKAGSPVAGAYVRFAVTGGGGTLSTTLDSTRATGAVANQWTFGPSVGLNTVTATVVDADKKPIPWVSPDTVTFSVRTFNAISAVGGDAQTALILAKLPVAPSVRLVDSLGKPRLGVPITFTPTGGGRVTTSIVSTGADGVASPGDWRLGDIPGDQALLVNVESAKLSLHATATGTPIHFMPNQIIGGGLATCAILTDNHASCWGQQPLVGDSTDSARTSPTPTKGNIPFKSLAGGASHFCGVDFNQAIYCWGGNTGVDTAGRLLNTFAPTLVVSDLAWTQIATGFAHTCALAMDQTPYCWGDNTTGQLGDRTVKSHVVPTQVYGGFKFSSVTAGSFHTCGLTLDGSAFCWGFNANGQLGDGTSLARAAPTVVSGALTVQSIGAGEGWTCALSTMGKPYCWGNVPGVNTVQTTPKDYPTAPTFTSLTVGGAHACALTGDGTAYCWGLNSGGQVGDSSTVTRTEPTKVAGGLKFSSISAGYTHTCALTKDGSAACWGLNRFGELGDSTAANRVTPRFLVLGVNP